jgi:hypothetical protein
MINLKQQLSLAIRTTTWGDFPDPVAQDLLQSPYIDLLNIEINQYNLPFLKPLAGGTFHYVLEAGDFVVRLGFGKLIERPIIEEILQPLYSGTVGTLKFEILPKAKTQLVLPIHLEQIIAKLTLKNYIWNDAGLDNIGLINGTPIIIDADGICPILNKEHAVKIIKNIIF